MILPLTSLRFIFALFVFCFHLSMLKTKTSQSFEKFYSVFFIEGFLGVSFFFILSGFVLAYSYQKKFLDNKINKSQFWIARFARIYPLYFLANTLSLYQFKGHFFEEPITVLTKFFLHLFLLQSFIPIPEVYLYFNSPGWSISTEMFFYLVFPLIIVYFFKDKEKYNLFFFTILASPLLIYFLTLIIPENYYDPVFYINPIVRTFDFLLGIAVFQVFQVIKNWKPSYLIGTLIEVVSILLFIVFFIYSPNIAKVFKNSIYYWVPIGLMILVFALQHGALSALLSNKILVFLGEISFGFYLFHMLVLINVAAINQKMGLTENIYLLIAFIFIVTIVFSWFTYEKFEKPFANYIKNKLINKNQPIPVASA